MHKDHIAAIDRYTGCVVEIIRPGRLSGKPLQGRFALVKKVIYTNERSFALTQETTGVGQTRVHHVPAEKLAPRIKVKLKLLDSRERIILADTDVSIHFTAQEVEDAKKKLRLARDKHV